MSGVIDEDLFRSVIVREGSSHVLLRVSNNAEGDGRA